MQNCTPHAICLNPALLPQSLWRSAADAPHENCGGSSRPSRSPCLQSFLAPVLETSCLGAVKKRNGLSVWKEANNPQAEDSAGHSVPPVRSCTRSKLFVTAMTASRLRIWQVTAAEDSMQSDVGISMENTISSPRMDRAPRFDRNRQPCLMMDPYERQPPSLMSRM